MPPAVPKPPGFLRQAFRRFWSDRGARFGVIGILLLMIPAIAAPLLANGRPLLLYTPETGLSLPFWRTLFAPDSPERLVEQFFNYILLFLPAALLIVLLTRCWKKFRVGLLIGTALLLLIPFFTVRKIMDKTDYRTLAAHPDNRALFAPIPYGPFEIAAAPLAEPTVQHWCGTDESGRDVAARLLYGGRSSLAVGLFATAIALVIGTAAGLVTGYFGGVVDLFGMRLVEILMCFPTFLLLLILMSMLKDRQFEQSMLVVIGIIGLTGWIGLAMLVRGEVLKQRALPYMESCEVSGIPLYRKLFIHLLPNITGPILISFTFGVAGAILAESGLSFLGFGVQPPTASWGGLLRQAFDNPLDYWHLTFFPGLALFIAVLAFNFTGEGLRKALNPKH